MIAREAEIFTHPQISRIPANRSHTLVELSVFCGFVASFQTSPVYYNYVYYQ